MAVFKTKAFNRFARKENIGDAILLETAAAVVAGRVDADLGGGVFKQRIARPGEGKSGGIRTLVLFRRGWHVFFAYGFAKSARANISGDELTAFRRLADEYLLLDSQQLTIAARGGEIIEVTARD